MERGRGLCNSVRFHYEQPSESSKELHPLICHFVKGKAVAGSGRTIRNRTRIGEWKISIVHFIINYTRYIKAGVNL